jgi:hypothetical protein
MSTEWLLVMDADEFLTIKTSVMATHWMTFWTLWIKTWRDTIPGGFRSSGITDWRPSCGRKLYPSQYRRFPAKGGVSNHVQALMPISLAPPLDP